MYCPACGTRCDQPLSYCKNCGTNLGALGIHREVEKAGTSIDTLVWVIVGTTITLLGMSLGALVVMTDGGIDARLGSAFVILSFVAWLVVETVLIWRLTSLKKIGEKLDSLPQPANLSTNSLDSPPARALHEGAGSVPSVTEQTTRTFEPVPRVHEPR